MAQTLINLKTSDYEHPFDKKTLEIVRKIPLLPAATNFIMHWTVIQRSIIAMCGSNFHITHSACPDLYSLATDVYRTLDMNAYPEIYAEQDYYINAYTTGHENDAFIVLSTGAVDRLSDTELKFVIGHETGHVKSGHVLYHLMVAYLKQLLKNVPLTHVAQMALWKWNRMSEFTADRAGLLACQDLKQSISAIMKMSGLPERYYNNASIDGFIQQAKEFELKYCGTTDKLFRLLEVFDEDHPWTIVRAAELIKWHESGDYEKILNKGAGKKCPNGHQVDPDMSVCPFCGYKF